MSVPDVLSDTYIENQIRSKAFHHFYKMNEDIEDLYMRFATSIVESSAPFKDIKLVEKWKADLREKIIEKRERRRKRKLEQDDK
ncbi:hypothetical protein LCGC14_3107490 [marine sediment metagenome]|uniref:Uncharacterized protein n=1 Tax=marine sediment metagenome TaxID=412755 RepID=A0A0F8YVZ0_9ZZZZ